MASCQVESFFDLQSSTFSYVVYEAEGSECAIIDSVLGFDVRTGRTSTSGAQAIIEFVRTRRLTVQWLLETHVHADHLSAAAFLREHLGGKIGISAKIVDVYHAFRHTYNLRDTFKLPAQQFDHLFGLDEEFRIGKLQAVALHVPGHTPADIAYRIGTDVVFVGDTIFMPDVGTARCDFPGGDAKMLYQSIRKLLSLPPQTRLCLCHDYPSNGRAPSSTSSVAAQLAANIHVRDGIDEAAFVTLRRRRDAGLDLPLLMLPSIQVNIQAGTLPAAEQNGVRYMKIPVDLM